MFTSHKTRSCRQRRAISPVSEKNWVLALTRFSSAAVKESPHMFSTEFGTLTPGSYKSGSSSFWCCKELSCDFWPFDLDLGSGRTSFTTSSIALTSSGEMNVVSGCFRGAGASLPWALRDFCLKQASKHTIKSTLMRGINIICQQW